MKKKRIEIVNILGTDWRVIYRDFPHAEDGSPCTTHGYTCADSYEIHINTLKPTTSHRDTLLHEVMHAIEEMLAIKLTEQQIRLFATSLRAFFRANPKEAAWIIK